MEGWCNSAVSRAVQNKYKMTMGLEPMNVNDWIEIDDAYEEEMALRKKLVAEKRDIVIHSMPGVRAHLQPTCADPPVPLHEALCSRAPLSSPHANASAAL